MLILSRREGEQIVIGDSIIVEVLAIDQGRIRLGIDAPLDVKIRRAELPEVLEKQQKPAGGRKAS